jgi:uncharacterized coiled-coil protein SlyX
MSDNDLNEQIVSLEMRLMHIEAAMDELTQTLLRQETQLNQQADTIRRLESLVKGIADAGMADQKQETPPPHY